ncbi:hypothetical protein N7454_009999 [Penicillium verhagenii]|nr:hypothetical protein N7454_009999 [Penicillium verhagenii]
MASDQSSLYGQRRAKSTKGTDTSNSSSLNFSSHLSSLIAQDSGTGRGRARPSKTPKSDLFAKPNKGAEKRLISDLKDEGHTEQVHKRSKDIGTVDEATLGRSKRKMAAKVRLYNDMKKGSHLAAQSSDEEDDYTPADSKGEDYYSRLRRKEKEGLVDFDRKWMDEQRKGDGDAGDEDEDEDDDDNASQVSYEDEFGRTRRGTRKEAALAARTRDQEANQERVTRERWQPARPDNLIYGATVQAEAFNPEETTMAAMAKLAARRDRSATPPEEVHYNADAEVRNRGTGFYSFSGDQDERKRQMDELLAARQETEQQRLARLDKRAAWDERMNHRREELAKLRGKRMTERLLKGLSGDAALAQRPEI